MSKIGLLILVVVAFLYAGWLVIMKRALPDPRLAAGLKKRFLLATLLFVGMLALSSYGKDKEAKTPAPPAKNEDGVKTADYITTLKAVWKTLDQKRGEEFRKQLEACVKDKNINEDVSKMLSLAYSEIGMHKERTRGKGAMMECYKMTQLGGSLQNVRENALKQIELLRSAKEKGAIDAETEKKAMETLAKELQMLDAAKNIASSKYDAEKEKNLLEKYTKGELVPGESAKSSAEIIVKMEKE